FVAPPGEDEEADEKRPAPVPDLSAGSRPAAVSPGSGAINPRDIVNARSHLDWLLAWLPWATAKDDWHDDSAGQSRLLRWQIYDEHDPVFSNRVEDSLQTDPEREANPVDETE